MRAFGIALAALALIVGLAVANATRRNALVVRELRERPDGERAKRVMLLTLPSGKALPVNYLREGEVVYAAADFPWWRELRGGGGRGSVLIRGETLPGHVRAVEDDAALRASVFARLRPNAVSWAGTLIVVELEPSSRLP
jgi:hypothetical protein